MNNRETQPGRLRNGEILTQKEFTELVVSQEALSALSLVTMAYGIPSPESHAAHIHRKLLSLADEGTQVRLGVEVKYAKRLLPKGDLPAFLALVVGQRALVKKVREAYAQLEDHPNAKVDYHGQDMRSYNPLGKVDHRKFLLLSHKDSEDPDEGVVFGFNINHTMERGVIDSGIYINDKDALQWIAQQQDTPHLSKPVKEKRGDFTFVTRELGEGGNELADEAVLDTINGAKDHLIYCGQFMPDGKEFDAFVGAAERGVRIDVISNYPSFSQQPIYSMFRYSLVKQLGRAAQRTGNIHFHAPRFPDQFVHMKGLVRDIENPHNAAVLTGNDNMTNRLLQHWGTREIQLRLDNHEHRLGLHDFIQRKVIPQVQEFDPSAIDIKQMIRNAAQQRRRIAQRRQTGD